MKNNKWIFLLVATIGLSGGGFAQTGTGLIAEDEVSFPAGAVRTVLTPEQEAEAGKLLNQARAVYADILNDDAEGKTEYLQSNLLFLDDRVEKTAKELKTKQAELDALNQQVIKKQDEINARKVDEKQKATLRIQLVDEFRNEKETLTFRINMLKNHLAGLENRQASIKDDLANLGASAVRAPTEAEKADLALEELRSAEQLKRFEKHNK